MALHPEADIEQLIGILEAQNDKRYKATLLYPLNVSVLLLVLIGLLTMLIAGSSLFSFSVVGFSLLLNICIFLGIKLGKINLSAHVFCQWINAGVLLYVCVNLVVRENILSAIIFSAILSMCVLLYGMFFGPAYAFAITIFDTIILAIAYSRYFAAFPSPDDSLFGSVARTLIPICGFLFIVAVISWLYQRALAQSAARLQAARQRIMRDELLRRDLAVARELQQRLYPPPPLTNANIRIASRSEPARETSGDFYDFIDLGDGRLGIVVADVTGKSIAAALVMAMSRGTLRAEARRHTSPAEVLRSANQTLCQDRSVRQMITAFYGILDTNTLTLHVSNAGHPFPTLRRNNRIEEIEVCGLPLGARPDALYSDTTLKLEPGDQLVLISDGLVEERNAARELFGFDRLAATISSAAADDPEQALDQIWQAVVTFRGNTEQSDDFTLVVIQVARELEAPATLRSEPRLQRVIIT